VISADKLETSHHRGLVGDKVPATTASPISVDVISADKPKTSHYRGLVGDAVLMTSIALKRALIAPIN
jgi:hypothetical protein